MLRNYITLKEEKTFYDYGCSSCGARFSRWPKYMSKLSWKGCKHCPECGHKFELEGEIINERK